PVPDVWPVLVGGRAEQARLDMDRFPFVIGPVLGDTTHVAHIEVDDSQIRFGCHGTRWPDHMALNDDRIDPGEFLRLSVHSSSQSAEYDVCHSECRVRFLTDSAFNP